MALYRLALSAAERTLRAATAGAAASPVLVLAWLAFLAVLLLVVARLVLWEPATSGSGIPQVDAEVVGRLDAPWHRVVPAKFAEGTLLALAGLSLGREGPSVQIGGMSGKAVSRVLGRRRGEERLLVTCGAAAGMSAAFHAPLTGVLFAIEEIHKEFSAPLIISVMCSSVAADYLVAGVLGARPVLSLSFTQNLPQTDYLLVVALGVICGLLGALHNRGMFAAQRLYGRIGRGGPYARLAVPFALAGAAAFVWPDLMCGGDAIVERLMSPAGLTAAGLAALLAGKYLFTAACFGSGAPGGTLFPLVVMGALLGGLYASLASGAGLLPDTFFPNFMALGVAGLFSGVVRAPVTAVVLVFELTGSLDALLSVSIVSVLSYVTANLLRVDAFYEHLLAAFLKTGVDDPSVSGGMGEKVLQNVRVGTGSRLEGMLVRDVPWPDGVRVMTVERAGAEIAATGETRLCALDGLLVMVDERVCEDAMLKLRLMSAPRVRG